jgi:hypothetical protein
MGLRSVLMPAHDQPEQAGEPVTLMTPLAAETGGAEEIGDGSLA